MQQTNLPTAGAASGVGAAAQACLEARRGGTPVAVVRLVPDAPGSIASAARHVLVRESGLEGSLGSPGLDEAALETGREALAKGSPAYRALSDGLALFAQGYRRTDPLVIAGGGHIAVELAALGVRLGFSVTVVEDREEFVDPARFAAGVSTRLVDFGDALVELPVSAETYLVLVTRGHAHDLDCLRAVLAGSIRPAYVGLIGSRRRVRAAFLALRGAGVADDRLAALRAPVGLDIGAETPAEIAVAIAAELIAVRRGVAPPGSLRDRVRVLDRLMTPEIE